MERKRKDIIKGAIRHGGTEIQDWFRYQPDPDSPYYDKRDHLERSCYHQPNHTKHKNKPNVQTGANMKAARTQR